jgi:hypothetical protein
MSDEEDRLYRLPLADFVSARNELAAALKKSGEPEAARRIRELPKPSASAWAVNQLYWRARPELDELVAAGDRHRLAQQAVLAGDGSELSDAERDRRRAIDAALRRIRAILSESGQAANESLMRRITTTLEAFASFGSANPIPMRGRLTEDLESPGFAALSALAPTPPSATELQAKENREHDEALAVARAELAKATARAERSAAAVDAARAALARAENEAGRAASEVGEAKARVTELEEKRGVVGASGEAAD